MDLIRTSLLDIAFDSGGPVEDALGWERFAVVGHADSGFRAEPALVVSMVHDHRRWRRGGTGRSDRLRPLRDRIEATEILTVPTLMIQGGADACDPPGESERQERFFSDGYRRVILDGLGHFPAREAPEAVAAHVIEHLARIPAGL